MMAKRRRRAKDIKLSSIDRISTLPEELLVFILSFLTLKEATTTSLVSRRWRYLWAFTRKLDFDGTEILEKADFTEKGERVLDSERRKYVEHVSRVLKSHLNPTIEKFRIFFDLSKTFESSINSWLSFAFAKKVESLELNLTDDSSMHLRGNDMDYTFPHKLFIRTNLLVNFKHLKRIAFNHVNVDDEALEFFLHNCPLLEDLSLSHSGGLSSVNISSQFRSLKRLEISYCDNLESLEICDSNLVYLKYQGVMIHFRLEIVPRLVELFIAGTVAANMKDIIVLFSSCFPQLETLMIERWDFSWKDTEMFYSSVKMCNLKKLVVRTYVNQDSSLLPLTNMIQASPLLQRFVLEALWMEPKIVKREVEKLTTTCSYDHLKDVEFVGYFGHVTDLEFVTHLLEKAVALEKIVVDPCEPTLSWWKESKQIKLEMSARVRARRQLTKKAAQARVKLCIL